MSLSPGSRSLLGGTSDPSTSSGPLTDPVAAISALNAMTPAASSALTPPASLAGTLPSNLPLPTVQVADQVVGAVASSDAGAPSATAGVVLPASIPEPGTLEMMAVIVLGLVARSLRVRESGAARSRSRPVTGCAGVRLASVTRRRTLRGQAGVGHEQGAVGPEALATGRLPDGLEEERRDGLAGDAESPGSFDRVGEGGLHHVAIEGRVGRHGVGQDQGAGDPELPMRTQDGGRLTGGLDPMLQRQPTGDGS